MATEQLRYDFELNLSRAEKSADAFVGRLEKRFDRVSNRLEKAMEKVTKGVAGGSSRSSGGSGVERDADRIIRRQTSAQKEVDRRQKQSARELAADKKRFQVEEDARLSQRDKRRKEQSKQIERLETGRNRIVEQFEQKRRTRKDAVDNINSRAELRSRGRLDSVDWLAEDDKALSKALAARRRFVAEVSRITQEGSWKSLSTIRTEVASQEQIYKSALDRVAAKNSARKKSGGGRFSAGGKAAMLGFQAQQMVEDYSYAGFRGLANNLAFVGATLGGPTGLAIIAGVAAKQVYDLTGAMMGWGKASEIAAERGRRAAQAMQDVDEIRRQAADIETGFRAPDDMKELTRRSENLKRDELRLSRREPASTQEDDIRIMGRMLELRESLKAAEATEGRTKGFGFVGGVAGRQAEGFRGAMAQLQSKLSVPVNIDNLESIIEKRKEAYLAALKDDGLLKHRIDHEGKLLEESRQVVLVKVETAELEDKITEKLREQQRIEERLTETAKDRAKSAREAITATADSFESKMLDTKSDMIQKQFEKRIDRMVDYDQRRQRNVFGRMFPQAGDAMKGQFEHWLGQRGESVRNAGEGELFNRQFQLAQKRAHALKARADQEAAAARLSARRGDMDGANSGYDQTIKSLEQIQELNWQFQSKGSNIGRQNDWLKVVEDFQQQIVSIQKEQATANDEFASSHGKVGKELEATENRLKEITKQIEAMSAADEQAVEPRKKVNAELDGTLKRLQQLHSMKDGGKAPVRAESPVGAGLGQVTLQRGAGRAAARAAAEKVAGGQSWMSAQDWGGVPFKGNATADGYSKMLLSALRNKEADLVQNPANEGMRRRELGGAWKMAGPLLRELESGVTERRAGQIAEELKQILEYVKALQGAGPIKIPVEIIEKYGAMIGPGGKYEMKPHEIGMPRGYRQSRGYRASGGPVSMNSPYVVGERGMEMFVPTVPGQIINATDTRRMLSSGMNSASSVSTTANSFATNFNIGSINAATVDLQDIHRQADWARKSAKVRMGN